MLIQAHSRTRSRSRSSGSGKAQAPERRGLLVIGGGALIAVFVFLAHGQWPGVVLPDLMTLYALFFVLYGSPKGRYVPCMVIGFIRDVLTMSPFGTFAILYALMHKLVFPMRNSIYRDNVFTQMFVTLASVFCIHVSYHLVLVLTIGGYGWSRALSNAFYIGLVSAPLMPLLVQGMKLLLWKLRVSKTPDGAYAF